eukprot:scaffold323_cov414-Prasinococcus_capsulatus_cf.AAC.33
MGVCLSRPATDGHLSAGGSEGTSSSHSLSAYNGTNGVRGGRRPQRSGLLKSPESSLWQSSSILSELDAHVQRREIDPETIELDEKVGEGAFGEVFKARWEGTEVAYKRMRAATLPTLARQVRAIPSNFTLVLLAARLPPPPHLTPTLFSLDRRSSARKCRFWSPCSIRTSCRSMGGPPFR